MQGCLLLHILAAEVVACIATTTESTCKSEHMKEKCSLLPSTPGPATSLIPAGQGGWQAMWLGIERDDG